MNYYTPINKYIPTYTSNYAYTLSEFENENKITDPDLITQLNRLDYQGLNKLGYYRRYYFDKSVDVLKILFLHGMRKHTDRPMFSTKSWAMQSDGYKVFIPKLPNNGLFLTIVNKFPILNAFTNDKVKGDFKAAVYVADLHFLENQCDLIVGSSMGGAIAMELSKEHPETPLILLAPAWKTFGVEPIVPKNTIIVHGKNDGLVNVKDSEKLAANNNCQLFVVDDEHQLNDVKSKKVYMKEIGKLAQSLGKIPVEYCCYIKSQSYQHTRYVWPGSLSTETPVKTTGYKSGYLWSFDDETKDWVLKKKV